MSKYAVIFLAAGESKRLGSPKQLLKLDGEYVFLKLVSYFSNRIDPLVVVTGCHAQQVMHICRDVDGITFIHNAQWSRGQGASLAAGIKSLPKDVTHAMVCLCDQILIPQTHYDSLMRLSEDRPNAIIASKYSNKMGVPVIFPRTYFSQLLAMKEQASGASQILREHNRQVVSMDCKEASFDIDTVEDVQNFSQQFNLKLSL